MVPDSRNISAANGLARVSIKLWPVTLTTPFLVTKIEDEVVLSSDVLQRDESGQADLLKAG